MFEVMNVNGLNHGLPHFIFSFLDFDYSFVGDCIHNKKSYVYTNHNSYRNFPSSKSKTIRRKHSKRDFPEKKKL